MDKLSAVSRVLGNICNSISAALILIMTLMVFVEAMSRYIFGISHEFVPDVSTWLMVWMTYFILGVALKGREHINVDILQNRLSPRRRIPLLTFFDIATLVFAVLLCVGGTQYDLMVKQSNIHTVTVQAIPMWIVRISVPLGSLFLAFFSIEHLIHDIRDLGKRIEEKS